MSVNWEPREPRWVYRRAENKRKFEGIMLAFAIGFGLWLIWLFSAIARWWRV